MLGFSRSQISTGCGDLLDEMIYAGMTQVNFIKNIKHNVLDLIFADDNIVKEGMQIQSTQDWLINTDSDAFCVSLNDFAINGDIICNAINRLKTSYNPGPDGIVAKKCNDALRAPLDTALGHFFGRFVSVAVLQISHIVYLHYLS